MGVSFGIGLFRRQKAETSLLMIEGEFDKRDKFFLWLITMVFFFI